LRGDTAGIGIGNVDGIGIGTATANGHPFTFASAFPIPIPMAFFMSALLLLAACSPPARPAPPLEPEDFVLAGVPLDADSVEIRLSFGEPDSIVVSANPYDASVPLQAWHYRGLVVRFEDEAVPAGYLVTGGAETTARGIRVGDPAATVLDRYGEPTFRYDDIWTYVEPLPTGEEHVIEFLIRDDSVASIHLARTRF
jgi:hypothetical protein